LYGLFAQATCIISDSPVLTLGLIPPHFAAAFRPKMCTFSGTIKGHSTKGAMKKRLNYRLFSILGFLMFLPIGLSAQAQPNDAELLRLADADSVQRIFSRDNGNFSGVFFARVAASQKWGIFNAFTPSKNTAQVVPILFDSLTLVHHPVYVYLAWQDGKMGLVENSRIQERVPLFLYQDGMYALDAQQNHYVLVKEKNRWFVLDARSQRPLSTKSWADPLRIPLPVK
jgi:hypothetical protein